MIRLRMNLKFNDLKIFIIKNKNKIRDFIIDKKASDDKNTGTIVAMITAVVVGLLIMTAMRTFLNDKFMPGVFDKLMNALNLS